MTAVEKREASGAGEGESVRSLLFLLGAVRELLGDGEPGLDPWQVRLRSLQEAEGGVLRVAVAGTVKSGKSTLVNALIGRDLLKRGAGIVTSLVTRVQPGPELRARMRLKGWEEVNREATDAALFLGAGEDRKSLDLRRPDQRRTLERALAALEGRDSNGGGFFDKNLTLLRALVDGYERVKDLVREEPRSVEFGPAEFGRHRDFAGDDALAAYVDDLMLEVPGLPFQGDFELADCQGYDSPNPRHMERVQDYLLSAHLVVFVISSRVGLREADLRFLRDIRAMGLADVTRVVLNADLGEHGTAEDLGSLRERVRGELQALTRGSPLYTFSGLRALLLAMKRSGEELARRDQLLLELWAESSAAEVDEYEAFLSFLEGELGSGRKARLARLRESVVRRGAEALRARVETALVLTGEEAAALETEGESLRAARARVEGSLESLENALSARAEALKRELFLQVDASFHPGGGTLAREILKEVRALEPPAGGLEAPNRRRLFHQMALVYQEMKASFQRYKVEVVNPKAVDRVRLLWTEAGRRLAETAAAPVELLVESVEVYRREATTLGIEIPPVERPPLDPDIGRRPIPLFSAVTYATGQFATDRALSFAGQWTRKLASGWAKRLVGRKERTGFARALLADGAEAVRELLAEEARSNLLHYNEQLKYQVLGRSLEALAAAWAEAYREMVKGLVLDLDHLALELKRAGSEREDLIPRLRGILDALEPLAA